MKNHKKIGLVSTMTPDKSWPQAVMDRVDKTHVKIKAMLEGMGFCVIDKGSLLRDYTEMQEAGRYLAVQDIKALVLYVGAWTYANCAVALAQDVKVPIIIWCDATPGTRGLVGGAIVRGALAEIGHYSHFIYETFDDDSAKKRCKELLEGICAASGLRGQIMGYGGGRTMGMVTATGDPVQIQRVFGIDIDCFEQMEIISRAKSQDEERVNKFINWMKQTYCSIIPSDAVLDRQVRLYFALREFCTENRYDFVTCRCLPEMAQEYTSFCLAHAIMGDAQDNEGPKDRFIVSCEADINAAITMQLLKLIQSGPVMFTDLSQYDFQNNVIVVCNCGSHPTDFAPSKKDVIWEREGVHNLKWKYGGTCPQQVAASGSCTLARLYREKGEYAMLITRAEAVEYDREKQRETVWERPHAYFKLNYDRRIFFDAVRSNHIHMVYGDQSRQLVEACRVLAICPVLLE